MATLVEVPHIGMDLSEVTIVEWLVEEGETVAAGDPILTIETDKTNHDLEAEVAGRIHNRRGQAGDVLAVGAPLAWIVGENEAVPDLPAADAAADTASEVEADAAPGDAVAGDAAAGDEVAATGGRRARPETAAVSGREPSASRGLASPAARREAAAQGRDVRTLAGSGPDGTVYRADVIAAGSEPTSSPRPAVEPEPAAGEVVALSRIQRLTGQRTQASFRDVPHFYLERDLSTDALRTLRSELTGRLGQRPSLGALLCFAIARTLPDHPRINGRLLTAETIELRREVHLGVAVARKDGLVVPVIRDAGVLRLPAFVERYRDLVTRAQADRLTPDEMTGGTFTVSNLGMFGIDRFNAIINAPQAAILALGRMRTVPRWQEQQKQWLPMSVMSATISVDHRVADGADGGRFLADLARRLTHWTLLL